MQQARKAVGRDRACGRGVSVFASVFDASREQVGPVCGKNRREKSFKRTVGWLTELTNRRAELGCEILAVCVGGTNMSMRERFVAHIADQDVQGDTLSVCNVDSREHNPQIVRSNQVSCWASCSAGRRTPTPWI
jgi:hypothetical protein